MHPTNNQIPPSKKRVLQHSEEPPRVLARGGSPFEMGIAPGAEELPSSGMVDGAVPLHLIDAQLYENEVIDSAWPEEGSHEKIGPRCSNLEVTTEEAAEVFRRLLDAI